MFKGFDRDCYKPIITDRGFAGRENNYIKYRSKMEKYKNLSPKKYLNLIRPYLRDLMNEHKPTAELNDNNNNNNSNNNNNINNNSNNNNNNNKFLKLGHISDTNKQNKKTTKKTKKKQNF